MHLLSKRGAREGVGHVGADSTGHRLSGVRPHRGALRSPIGRDEAADQHLPAQ